MAIFGGSFFTHINGRSRILMGVHAMFTQVHAMFTLPPAPWPLPEIYHDFDQHFLICPIMIDLSGKLADTWQHHT